jgi:LmbE family N-acetylglucosaminyl deacetylase
VASQEAAENNAEGKESDVTAATVKIEPEGWETPQTILAILAHPDDPEFFCGASIARWASQGHTVHYCLLTHGDKGVREKMADPQELARMREREQRGAADTLGVKELLFLDYLDGYLVPDLAARLAVTRVIRQLKPDVVVTCDPTYIFGENSINHPDHRAVGQIVVDAIYPATGNPLFFTELLDEGLQPHSVAEVWLTVTGQPNITIDVSPYWEKKIQALHCHASQISDMNQLDERLRSRHTADSTLEAPRYEEKFRRFKFR